jgi:peptide/nickel transport system substrate-binding protein
VVYYPYAPDSAKALLAEIGFEDTDGNGILNWTSGPLEGQDLIISMFANEDQQEAVNIAEALVNSWGEVGIQVNFRPVTAAFYDSEMTVSGEWDMHVYRSLQEFALPFTRCTDLAPVSKTRPQWHREGEKPRELQPFEEELIKLVNQYCVEKDQAKRKELINEYNHVFTENVYNLGIFVSRYGLALAKRFHNVPPGTPAFLYDWVEYSLMPEQVWSPKDQQIEEVRPDTIPVYKKQ